MSLFLVKSDYRLGALVAAPSRGRARYLYLLRERTLAPDFAFSDINRCVRVRRSVDGPEGVREVAA